MSRIAPVLILFAGLLGAGATLGAETSAEERSELEARLNQARQEVQESARRLAEVLKEQMADNPEEKVAEWFSLDTGGELGVMINSDDDQGGVLLMEVSPGGGADLAGLKPGDRLLMIDGVQLDGDGGVEALLDHMNAVDAGQEVAVVALRDGESKAVTVVTQPRSMRAYVGSVLDGLNVSEELIDPLRQRVQDSPGPRLIDLDAGLGAYFGVDQGVLVLNALEDGALKSGDVLLSVDGEAVTTASEARKAIADHEAPVRATILRHENQLEVLINPGDFPRRWIERIEVIALDEGDPP